MPIRPASRTATLQRSGGARGSAVQLSGAQLWRVWAFVGWTITLAGLIVGFDWIRGYVEAQPTQTRIRVDWMNLPDWITRDDTTWILEQIEAAATVDPDTPVFDERLTAEIGQRLAQLPWIASVERVTKQLDGTIRIWATFREPFAFVDVKGQAYLVDATGIRLPIEYGTDFVEGHGHDIITGVAKPIPDVGQQWQGDDVQAGLALARFLADAARRGETPFRSSIRAVDVSNFSGKVSRMAGKLRLKTVYPGAYVEWGLPPGDENGVEATAAQKLLGLREVYVQMGGQLPVKRIDVRGAGGVVLHDLPQAAPDPKPAPKPKSDASDRRRP